MIMKFTSMLLPMVAMTSTEPPQTYPPTTLNVGEYEIEVVVDEEGKFTDQIDGLDPFTVVSFLKSVL